MSTNKYETGQVVWLKNKDFPLGTKAKILKFGILPKNSINNLKDQLIYLLILPSQERILTLTTATEDQISPI